MLRGEFKTLTGLDIPESVFEVIHKDYMASKQDKEDYCAQFNDTLYLGTPHTISEVEPIPTIDLAVTNVLSLTVSHSDEYSNPIEELGSVTIYGETNDNNVTVDITAYNLNTDTPKTFVQFYGRVTPTEDFVDIKFSVLIKILSAIQNEPMKTVAQLMLNDLTVRFADIIARGE